MILGVSGLLFPIAVAEISLVFTAPVMIFISVVLLIFISTGWEIKRWEGAALLSLYAAFLFVLFRVS